MPGDLTFTIMVVKYLTVHCRTQLGSVADDPKSPLHILGPNGRLAIVIDPMLAKCIHAYEACPTWNNTQSHSRFANGRKITDISAPQHNVTDSLHASVIGPPHDRRNCINARVFIHSLQQLIKEDGVLYHDIIIQRTIVLAVQLCQKHYADISPFGAPQVPTEFANIDIRIPRADFLIGAVLGSAVQQQQMHVGSSAEGTRKLLQEVKCHLLLVMG